MAFQCNKCQRTVGCGCPEVAEEAQAAMHLGRFILDLMGSPAGALGEVSFEDPGARVLYERLWRTVTEGYTEQEPEVVPLGEPAWERLLDPKL